MVYLTNPYERNNNNIQNFTILYCLYYTRTGRPDYVSNIELQDVKKISLYFCVVKQTNKQTQPQFIYCRHFTIWA